MTINKSQEQLLKKVETYLKNPLFVYKKLYVVLS